MDMKKIKFLHQLVSDGARVCTDSRQPEPGGIFFALRGEAFNGNIFARKALEAGCRLAVIDDPAVTGEQAVTADPAGTSGPDYHHGSSYLLVESVLDTLQELSAYHRSLFDIPMMGITGSNGKTTTKELVHAVLSTRFQAPATRGNLNNHIGVPVTLLALKKTVDMAIIEMGANHVGEIARLCQLAKPTHGLITNIGKAHLEGFGSVENIARAKSELYSAVAGNSGVLFVNGDNELLVRLAANAMQSWGKRKEGGALSKRPSSLVTYGVGPDNHCRGWVENPFPLLEISFEVKQVFGDALPGYRGKIRSQLTGVYNFENIMAAVTVGLYFGIPPEMVSEAIEAYRPENNRSQMIQTERNLVISDAYNANPTSMRAALENFSRFGREKTAVLLGDMLELGETEHLEHEQMLKKALEGGYAMLVFVGPAFSAAAAKEKKLPANCHVFPDVGAAGAFLSAHSPDGYKILVKGSRGISMERLLEFL
jgi:UDP-N-acetylmuramoyl-tripeptide--D-alanyl-D-alanine ligase